METLQEPPLTPADNEKFLQMLKDRKHKLGIEAPKMEVRFNNLTVEAEVYVSRQRRALPTLYNICVNGLQDLTRILYLTSKKKERIPILEGLSGILRPSRMTLVLGSPGSGKSTFLKALSGKHDPALKFTGRVTYNGKELAKSSANFLSAYVSQYDLHHAEMTVRETLDFSGRMLGSTNTFDTLKEAIGRKTRTAEGVDSDREVFLKATTSGKGRNMTTNYIVKLLGLCECADIPIGDEMRRGISGGEKKRVTIGEMLVGLARCYFMDDISNGLDSSTTFGIIKFLQQMAHFMDLTMVISLLQPPPETFELFDDLIILCKGQILYQGPREKVLDFFRILGFECPERKNIADFLQEVTSEMDQAQYWTGNKNDYQYISSERIAESFGTSYWGQHLKNEIDKPKDIPEDNIFVTMSGNNLSKWGAFKACFGREVLLFKRNSPVHIFKTLQIMLLGVVIMTLFLRTQMPHNSFSDGNKFLGALFIGVAVIKFNGMAEIAMTMKRVPILFKQRELLHLPGWAIVSSIFILSLPISLVETGVWTSLTYYVIGFAPSAVRFFNQFLALFYVNQVAMSLFRLLAVLGRTPVIANVLSCLVLIAMYILGGFVVSKDNIPRWMIWGYWASPLTYSQNAVALNEFLDDRWSMKFQYAHLDADTVGKAVLRTRGVPTEWHWFWISIGALFCFSIIFNILTIFALDYLNLPRINQAGVISKNKGMRTTKNDKQLVKGRAPKEETIMPFSPLTLAFSHISYFVEMPAEMKNHGLKGKKLQLLRDVSGAFTPGVLTALMGVTGAGKTTLLDVLAGRKTGGYIEGSVTISGYPKKQEIFAKISGYCEQTDIHSPFVTVFESLQYAAWLRLPANVDRSARNMFVEEVMNLVELMPLKNAMVGLPGNGLSAEQRKRLTIAVELVSCPSIIFMDEPTSGLDARAAAIVMRAVRKTVDTGRTVVCTIHQPSIEIFESFDELLLMRRGGQLIYNGSLGSLSQKMIKYFEAIPGVPKIRDGQNPAAWMLDITSHTTECKICVNYADIFGKSSLYRENLELVDELSKPPPNSENLHFNSGYWPNFKEQCIACLWKQHKSYWKNPEGNIVRFMITLGSSLLYGVVFWKVASKITSEQDIFNILGIMYGSALFQGFANTSLIQPTVGMERIVLYRERSAGMYTSTPYTIAQVAIEIPYVIVQVFIFLFIVYPMTGFQFSVVKFFWFMLFRLLSFMYFSMFGMMTTALTPNQELAGLLSFLIFLVWNVFSGFIISRKLIPVWWRWLYWADPTAWTVYGMMFSQLGDLDQLIQVPGEPDQPIKEFLEDYLGIQGDYFGLIVILHIGIIMLFAYVFGISIKYLNYQRR